MSKAMIDVSGIDWGLLNKQKIWLICFEPDFEEELEDEGVVKDAERARGLVHLIDDIQDRAVKAGLSEKEVFDL